MSADDTKPPLGWDKMIPMTSSLVAIVVVLVGAISWFTNLQSGLTQVQTVQTAQAARIDRIEESRTLGMQRLAKTEEAVSSMKDSLVQINAKLDRVLLRDH